MAIDSSRLVSDSLIGRRPNGMGKFHFVVLASLRAAQLKRGCTPRVEFTTGTHKPTVTAQFEVSEGKVPEIIAE